MCSRHDGVHIDTYELQANARPDLSGEVETG